MNHVMICLLVVASGCAALAVGIAPCLASEPSDSEVQDRVVEAAAAIRANIAVATMVRGVEFAKRGDVDLFVASTVTWDLKANDHRLWEPPFVLGKTAVEKADMTGEHEPRGNPILCREFAQYRKNDHPIYVRTDVVYCRRDKDEAGKPIVVYGVAIMAAGVDDPQSFSRSLVVSRGPVSAKVVIDASLVLATGDVTVGDGMHNSVIICDGNVVVTRNTSNSLIIARGRVTIKGKVWSGTLIAGERVVTGEVVVPLDPVAAMQNRLVIEEKKPNPLGFITFFELSRIGLEVKVAEGAVKVAAVTAGKPCEKAGVKVGDAILEVNGKKPLDAESLRRLLRDNLAIGDATIKLKRGDKTETVKVALPE
ncbi:MAG: PDZ domain-containing protein [Planctomycetia bacterium]|nr:PDZ domain-containing protein [Planctomycetia bacterium]